jgi:quercetin dioxygenase-like cupin family protein
MRTLTPMDSWDLTALDVEVHKPAVLRSDDGAARAIAINLPAGDMLQDHQVHEHAYIVVVSGRLEIQHDVSHWQPHERHEVRATEDARFLLFLAPWPGEGHPNLGR